MFEIQIDNARYWRDCIEPIVNLIDEGTFNITKEGIRLRAMDPSNISMVSFFMPAKAFSKYKVDEKENISINLENLYKILSRARENEALLMKNDSSKMLLEFIGKTSKRRYKLSLLEESKAIEKEPNVEFTANIEISSDSLKDIIKDASMISQYISFKASKDQFSINAKGDSGELEEIHELDGNVLRKLEAKEVAEATYNLEFLESMVKSCPSNSFISIYLKGKEEPIKIYYNIGDAEITYYLAPYYSEE